MAPNIPKRALTKCAQAAQRARHAQPNQIREPCKNPMQNLANNKKKMAPDRY
jgi:hypothetical protein